MIRPRAATAILVAAALPLAAGCAHHGPSSTAGGEGAGGSLGPAEEGWASWYDEGKGGRTASGEPFDPSALTAAHRRLPFGTVVSVENVRNGRVVRVRITDRGPYGKHGKPRILDVSPAAARQLDMIDAGVVPIRLRVVAKRPAS